MYKASPGSKFVGPLSSNDYEDLGPGNLAHSIWPAPAGCNPDPGRWRSPNMGCAPGHRCVGTVGVLIEGKRLGHLERLAPELDRLTVLGFRMGLPCGSLRWSRLARADDITALTRLRLLAMHSPAEITHPGHFVVGKRALFQCGQILADLRGGLGR